MNWFCIPNARFGDPHCAELSTVTYMGNRQCLVCRQYEKGEGGYQPRYQLPVTIRTALWSVYHQDALSDWVIAYGDHA